MVRTQSIKKKIWQIRRPEKTGLASHIIVVNVLKKGEQRRGLEVAGKDLIEISKPDEQTAKIRLPEKFDGPQWKPSGLHPVEIIDGQHRLWAFESDGFGEHFELPVVAFHGLDISWQAYLFWTINIKPKRINASLAFDLYPLLRTEDWLEKLEGHSIYRETRAQELTEALWAMRASPWYQRINMLGESGMKVQMVSQAAWIRALISTFVRRSKGLFGAALGEHREPLPWSRAQQAAFLIFIGQEMRDAVQHTKDQWTKSIRAVPKQVDTGDPDPAFYGPNTLFSTDQGIRGLLNVTNDMCFQRARELKLDTWRIPGNGDASDEAAVSGALKSLKNEKVASFVADLCKCLAKYDWRTSAAPGLTEPERARKAAFRGSGGYKDLRLDLLNRIVQEGHDLGRAAKNVLSGSGGNA
jgi:DGQHR domain-containing protein